MPSRSPPVATRLSGWGVGRRARGELLSGGLGPGEVIGVGGAEQGGMQKDE